VQANGNSADFAPGFRFDTIEDGKMCCRLKGTFDGSVCNVPACDGTDTPYTDFALDTADAPVCYAECLLASNDLIGSDPEANLSPNIEGYWDDRDQPLEKYTGAPITTATFADASGNDRRWVLAFDNNAATTGVALSVGGDIYVCRLRGMIDGSGDCLVGCGSITQDYLALGTTAGDRCYTDCWSQQA